MTITSSKVILRDNEDMEIRAAPTGDESDDEFNSLAIEEGGVIMV